MPSPAYEPAHCIVCGHAQSEEVANEDDIREEVEALWSFHERRLAPGIPIDRLRDRVAFSQYPPFRLVACVECGLVYRNPTERSFEIESIYSRDCPPTEMLRTLHETQRDAYTRQAGRLRRLVHRGANVLEVGSYVGAFLSAAREAGLSAVGVDINPAVNRFARSLGFDVRDGQFVSSGDEPMDAIVIWNTLDQLADPRSVVIAARGRLRPGGVLAIRVPNGEFYRRWRGRLHGRARAIARIVLAQNNLLTFPYRWGFSLRSLDKLLVESGLRPVRVIGDVLVPTADGFTKHWARGEELLAKRLFKAIGRRHAESAPWLEVYATAPPAGA